MKKEVLKILMETKHPWWNKISKKKVNHKTLNKHMKKMMLQCKRDDNFPIEYVIIGGD